MAVVKANKRNNMYNPVKRMLRRTIGNRLTKIEDNSKTYIQKDNDVLEKLTLSYDDDAALYNVEGENVGVWDLMRDENGRLESVLMTNKVTDRAVQINLVYDDEFERLVEVIPVVLNEGTPLGYDEEEDDTSSYEPEVPGEDDVDLEPTTNGTVTDYDWTDRNGEGELM